MLIEGLPSFLFISLGLYILPFAVFHSGREPYKTCAGGFAAAAMVFAYLAYRRVQEKRSWADFGFVRPTFLDVGYGILIALATMAGDLAVHVLPLNPSAVEFNNFPSAVSDPFALTLYLAGILGLSFSEECIFRAYLIPSLEKHFRPISVVLASSALFGLVHFLGVVKTFFSGLILGSVFTRRRNIWPVVIGHFLHNVVVTLVGYSFLERTVSK